MTDRLQHLETWRDAPYDAVIVGGGAAGMSAALVLGRARKRVLVVDDQRPNFQVAIDIWTEGREVKLVGLPLVQGYRAGLAELARGLPFMPTTQTGCGPAVATSGAGCSRTARPGPARR